MNEYASLTGNTLRIERRLPGPIERVWAYIVESEKRALWFVGGEWELKPGGVAHVEFDHRRLSHEATPEEWTGMDGATMTATITRVDPPRLLAYRADMGGGDSDVTFELRPHGDGVILTISQTPVDAQGKANFGSGWHAHLDILEDRVRGVKPRGFWTNFNRLLGEYSKA